jgi:hypothetical protein
MTMKGPRDSKDSEIAALILEIERLSDPELPEYVTWWGQHRGRLGLTVDQTISIAALHRSADLHCEAGASIDAAMPLELSAPVIDFVEGRALAAASEYIADEQCPCGAFEMDGQILHSARCTHGYKHGGPMTNVIAFRLRETLS